MQAFLRTEIMQQMKPGENPKGDFQLPLFFWQRMQKYRPHMGDLWTYFALSLKRWIFKRSLKSSKVRWALNWGEYLWGHHSNAREKRQCWVTTHLPVPYTWCNLLLLICNLLLPFHAPRFGVIILRVWLIVWCICTFCILNEWWMKIIFIQLINNACMRN